MELCNFVYLRDVDNLSDARFAAGMGVNLIGFRLDPNVERALTAEQFNEIYGWISGIDIAGEFETADAETIKKVSDTFEFDYLLTGRPELLNELTLLGIPLILKLDMEQYGPTRLEETLSFAKDTADFFLLESSHDKTDDDEQQYLARLAVKYPIVLGYGIHTENATRLVDELHLKGLSLKGSPELRPGYKDFDELADILEAMEI